MTVHSPLIPDDHAPLPTMHLSTPPFHSSRRSRSLVRAAAIGAFADLGATLVAAAYLMAFDLLGMVCSGIASGAVPASSEFSETWAFLVASVLIGTLASLLGGFVAGRLEPMYPGAVGLLVGFLSVLSALGLTALFRDTSPIQTSEVVAFALAFLASICGAYLGSKHPAPRAGYA